MTHVSDRSLVRTTAAHDVEADGEPLPPGGRSEYVPPPAAGALPAVVGAPPVASAVPVPGVQVGRHLPGVQLSQRPRHPGDRFGWPSNAAPGKPEGEVDTRN